MIRRLLRRLGFFGFVDAHPAYSSNEEIDAALDRHPEPDGWADIAGDSPISEATYGPGWPD